MRRNWYDPAMSDHPVIGHVHLKVSELERSVEFYSDVLGMELQQRYGHSAAFLSYGAYHHHLGLNIWESMGGSPPPPGATGLFHLAILYPTRKALAAAFSRVIEHGITIDGASDHGVSEAIYFRDPDENGIEIYRDRPETEWPRKNGQLAMISEPLDLEGLLAELA